MKKNHYIIIWLCLFTLFTSIVEASTKEVVVVTSFPKELFETYKKPFEATYSGVKVIVKQKQTTEGVTYIRETASKPEADIMWASAVDAFQVLKTEKLLAQYLPPGQISFSISGQNRFKSSIPMRLFPMGIESKEPSRPLHISAHWFNMKLK